MRKIKNFIQNIVAVAIVVFFAHYLWVHRTDFFTLLHLSWLYAVILGFGILLTWALNSIQICYLLRTIGINIGFGESFLLFIVTAMGNHVPMRPGTLLRLHYLKTVHNLRYARMGSVIGVRMVLLLFVSGILGVIGVFGYSFETDRISYPLLTIFSGMTLLSVIIYLKPPKKNMKQKRWIFRLWNDFTEGFDVLHEKPGVLIFTMLLILLQLLTMSARLYISFNTIGLYPSPYILLILTPVSVIMIFMAITPGGIGLREWLIGIISTSLGYDFQKGIFAASIDRAFMLLLIFTIGSFALCYIWYQIKQADHKIKRTNTNRDPGE